MLGGLEPSDDGSSPSCPIMKIDVSDEVFDALNARAQESLSVWGGVLHTNPRNVRTMNDVIENLLEIAYGEGL